MNTRIADALARRVRMLLSRAVVTLVNDALKIQGLQLTVLDSETVQVQRFQQYGLTSVPLAGAEAIVGSIGGVRSHLVALAVDDGRYRLANLQPGEVALYDNSGNVIHLHNGGVIGITAQTAINVTAPQVTVAASDQLTVNTPQATFSGNVTIDGKLNTTGDITTDTQVTATNQVTADGITLTSRAAA